MTFEADQNSEVNEAVPQDQNQTHEQVEQVQEAQIEKPLGGPSREHFRRLEQSKKELERELKLQKEMLERFMTAQPAPQPVQEVDEFDSIADDDYIPKGKVDKRIEKRAAVIAEQIVERKLKEVEQKQHQATFMNRLKGQFSDFDEVVNPETLQILEDTNPELAQTIVESKDPYKIGLQSYKFIKAMGLHAKEPQTAQSKDVEKKLASNAKTVQSPQAFSKRPMAQAFNPTKEELAAAYKEMHHYASQANLSY